MQLHDGQHHRELRQPQLHISPYAWRLFHMKAWLWVQVVSSVNATAQRLPDCLVLWSCAAQFRVRLPGGPSAAIPYRRVPALPAALSIKPPALAHDILFAAAPNTWSDWTPWTNCPRCMRRDDEPGFVSYRHRDCLSGINNCTALESSVPSGSTNNSEPRTRDTQSIRCEPGICIPGVRHEEPALWLRANDRHFFSFYYRYRVIR
jgi:hypothetical protein